MTMELQEFTEILEAGLSEAKVGVIPPGIDQVQVGDIRRTRLAHVKVLFLLGLNDGWVPARGNDGGIVSDMERELLKENGMELAPTAREKQLYPALLSVPEPDEAVAASVSVAVSWQQ